MNVWNSPYFLKTESHHACKYGALVGFMLLVKLNVLSEPAADSHERRVCATTQSNAGRADRTAADNIQAWLQ